MATAHARTREARVGKSARAAAAAHHARARLGRVLALRLARLVVHDAVDARLPRLCWGLMRVCGRAASERGARRRSHTRRTSNTPRQGPPFMNLHHAHSGSAASCDDVRGCCSGVEGCAVSAIARAAASSAANVRVARARTNLWYARSVWRSPLAYQSAPHHATRKNTGTAQLARPRALKNARARAPPRIHCVFWGLGTAFLCARCTTALL